MLHRRTSFAFAAAALAPTALAQAQTAQSPQPGATDERMRMALASYLSLMTARLGVERATSQHVRRFAQLEVAEQEAAIAAMSLAGVNVPREFTLPSDKSRMLQQLQGQRGEEFDMAFLAAQKSGHEELLAIHTAMAHAAGTASERIISTMAVPAIRSHLAMIEMLQERGRG